MNRPQRPRRTRTASMRPVSKQHGQAADRGGGEQAERPLVEPHRREVGRPEPERHLRRGVLHLDEPVRDEREVVRRGRGGQVARQHPVVLLDVPEHPRDGRERVDDAAPQEQPPEAPDAARGPPDGRGHQQERVRQRDDLDRARDAGQQREPPRRSSLTQLQPGHAHRQDRQRHHERVALDRAHVVHEAAHRAEDHGGHARHQRPVRGVAAEGPVERGDAGHHEEDAQLAQHEDLAVAVEDPVERRGDVVVERRLDRLQLRHRARVGRVRQRRAALLRRERLLERDVVRPRRLGRAEDDDVAADHRRQARLGDLRDVAEVARLVDRSVDRLALRVVRAGHEDHEQPQQQQGSRDPDVGRRAEQALTRGSELARRHARRLSARSSPAP